MTGRCQEKKSSPVPTRDQTRSSRLLNLRAKSW